jgi:transcriptional regulator of acetoin/glycerol metabolism
MERMQREHIHAVMRLATHGAALRGATTDDDAQRAAVPIVEDGAGAVAPDSVIQQSWARCVHQHGLDPTRMQEAVILPAQRVREHQERLDEFLRIARHGLEALYGQVAGMGYCVLLTDARGVTVDFLGDLQLDTSLRRAGLYLGSDWNELHAGTCGVGTAIATGQALVVHQGDHFDATHITLTCTAAPIYDPLGRLNAILDISALTSPQAKSSQHLTLQIAKVYASRVENAYFLRCHRNDWVAKLHPSPEFVEISPDYLLALDVSGRIVGHNRAAQLMLEAEHGGTSVLGLPFEQLFHARFGDLPRYMRAMPGERRAVTLARSARVLYLHAVPPPPRVMASRVDDDAGATRAAARAKTTDVEGGTVPAPLAALSGGDAAFDRQIARAARLADTPVSLLVTGETGSGKEYFAKAVHASSRRAARPFVAVNCAAIPESLIESELFGHLPGSFSGAATKGKRGLVHEADGGTLFLDEIGDMPLALQPRLLRVLAEREVLPVGATRAVKVDVRVIAATHADLQALVKAGRFRDDLYYRLAGAPFAMPPLRERRDLPWLAAKLLRDGGHRASLAPEVIDWFAAYPWPGNLREMKNVLDYAAAMARAPRQDDAPGDGQGSVIGLADLPDPFTQAMTGKGAGAASLEPSRVASAPASLQSPATPRAASPYEPSRAAPSPSTTTPSDAPALPPEAQLLLQYLRAARWNVAAVAHQMGVARMTIYRRMQRWGLREPE